MRKQRTQIELFMANFTLLYRISKFFFICLLFFAPFLSRAQVVDLASWALTSDFNAVSLIPEVNASQVTGQNIFGYFPSGLATYGWTGSSSINTNQYVQIAISPTPGNNIFVNNLLLTHREVPFFGIRGPRRYSIRYSKNPSFSSFTNLVNNSNTSQSGIAENRAINVDVFDGETLYIRFYGFRSDTASGGGDWVFDTNTLKITGSVKQCANTTTWTPSGWNTGGVPDLTKKVVINANYSTATNGTFNACELIVNGGKVLTVSSGTTIRVAKGVDTSPGGQIVIEDSGSLVQINDDAVNIGDVVVLRTARSVTRFDFTYWSSPVSSQILFGVSPNTLKDKYFSYDTAVQNWKTEMNGTPAMAPGVGYIIRSPQSFSTTVPSDFNAQFVGTPNNGVVNVSIPLAAGSTGNFALVGNPYPSAVDADAFITQNAAVLKGALYFWTHNTPINNNIYNANDYAVYTLMGGVGTSGNPIPNGNIASGQSFFVDLNDGLGTGTNLVFNNSMRIYAINQNNQFFAANQSRSGVTVGGLSTNTTTGAATTASKSRLWLNLTNDQGAFSQILVGYADAATNGYDHLLDGLFLDGFENIVSFYSLMQDQSLSVQAKAMPVEGGDTIPLGYKSGIAGTFTISIADLDGLFADQDVVLEDKLTGMSQLLKEADYTFTTEKGTFNDRFVISVPNVTLGTDDFIIDENLSVQIFTTGGQLTVKTVNESLLAVSVYDITGRLLFNQANLVQDELTLPIQKSNQILVAKIELGNGQKITKKILF